VVATIGGTLDSKCNPRRVMDTVPSQSWARRLTISVAVFWALIGLSAVTTGTFVGFLIGFVALGGGFYLFVTILQPLGTEVGESAWRLLLNRSVARRHHAAIHASLREVLRPSGISQVLRATGWNPLLARGLLVLLAAIVAVLIFLPAFAFRDWVVARPRSAIGSPGRVHT
jgi:hypothetical protein